MLSLVPQTLWKSTDLTYTFLWHDSLSTVYCSSYHHNIVPMRLLWIVGNKWLMNGWMNKWMISTINLWIISKLLRQTCASDLCPYSIIKMFANEHWHWTIFDIMGARIEACQSSGFISLTVKLLFHGPGCHCCFPRSQEYHMTWSCILAF